MKENGRVSSLLVELVIVLLFFMLASTTLMEIFGAAREKSTRATACNAAMLSSQNVAEALYAAPDADAALIAMGFTRENDAWTRNEGDYRLAVDCQEVPAGVGVMREAAVTAYWKDETLITLPASRYFSGEVEP